jgi:hypothetical protein
MRSRVAFLAVVVACLAVAMPAQAKLPPSGTYGCADYSVSPPVFTGNLKIDGSSYRVGNSRRGKIVNPKDRKSGSAAGRGAACFAGDGRA